MTDDVTPTNPQPIDVLQAQLDAFRKDPTDADLYVELRAALRKSGHPDLLAEICELRAPHERDPRKAAAMWSEAGEARLLIGDEHRGDRDLRQALAIDPADERAAARYAERLMVAERFADAAAVLEAELAELERRAADAAGARKRAAEPFAARRAQRHRLLAQLWDERLGRVDRALHHWQRAWRLEPDKPDAIEAARAIYASLGDHDMVAELYRAELAAIGERAPARRRAELELALGRLMLRRGDAAAAAAHAENAVALAPDWADARETLAEVYASPVFAGESDPQRRAGELFVELGRAALDDDDRERAITYLRRALGVDPYSRAGTESLEEALAIDDRWEELDRLYQHRLGLTDDPRERLVLLRKRALLYEEQIDDRDELIAILEQIAAAEPPGGDASRRLRQLYRETENWAALAALIERDIANVPEEPGPLTDALLELATIAKEHLRERDRAAEYLHRILTIDPTHPEALARYHEHFRERRDWRGLADLTEFAIDNARDAGAPPGEIVRQLEELAQLAEMRLGDVDRAVATWQRVQQIEPDNPRAREALRRLASRAKMWESLVGVLEQEAAQAQSPAERAEALRRIAQVYRERHVHPRQAIALFEEVLQTFPGDESALKALAELYEREGDDAGLARTLRRQLDVDARRVAERLRAEGKAAASARDWPVAQRVERLTTLRRLATMYEQRLADVEGVVFACAGILEILPGDRDALDRMERVLERAGDTVRLEQTLEYHAEAATGPAERARVLRRLARLARDRDDPAAAMERWERVLAATPNDAEALVELAHLYETYRRWSELADVLERSLALERAPAAGTPEAARRAAKLKKLARVVDRELGDDARAIRAWRQLLDIQPKDRDALDALARLYEARGQWRDLTEILERQAPLYAHDDPAKAAEVILRRARLLEERLGAPVEAIDALEALLAEVDPGNLDAHKALRRLYEARGDFDAAVRIAEREMYLSAGEAEKIARGMEIGLLCRDQLGDATRALQAFERVLELAPDHDEALAAAAELYAQVGDWHRHVDALERRLPRVAAERDRRALYIRIAQAKAERLHDPEGAFAVLRTAHEELPDPTTIAELRRAAEAYGLWAELADVYDRERRSLAGAGGPADPDAYVAASRQVAAIAERRLGDRARAMDALRDALAAAPLDDGLVAEAERIALEADEPALWQKLIDVLGVPLTAVGRAERVALHTRRARIYEERLDDPKGAFEELLRAFAWEPQRDETRQAIYALAERTRRWTDVVAVEAALFQRAPSREEAIAVLRRKAQVIEDHLHERVRAFRTHLAAFLLAPDDGDTVAHLWRLARDIGDYRPADRRPKPEPPPAHVEPTEIDEPAAVQSARPTAPGRRAADTVPAPRIEIQSTTSRGEPTQELTLSDLIPLAGGPQPPPREDSTVELDLNDLEPVARQGESRGDPTIELRTEDLIQALRPGDDTAPVPPPQSSRPRLPGVRAPGQPPPPPPRRPTIERHPRSPRSATPPAAKRAAPRPVRGRSLPAMPDRDYASAWDEFATAYELLPAASDADKLRWLFRAAEVWEAGARDVDRAFEVLERALALAPDDAEPRARLHRLAADHDRWDRLAELYEAAAERADTADTAAALYMEVAAIRANQGHAQQTERLYRKVLGMRPDDAVARERLEALYRASDRWVDLAASLEERTDPRLGAAAPEAERPALLRELASIYRDKLHRPHDALDALDRLRKLVPDDLDVLDQIAEINQEAGHFSAVVDALHKIADLAEGTPRAREALRRIGAIYEREIELPDRAIDAYNEIIAAWPDDADAYAALDRLYESHARWHELADTLRRRASLADDPAERAALLHRRARVLLDWLGNPDEAAAALRHARTLNPDDPQLADDLVTALVKAGREREAAAVLEGRVEALTRDGAAAGDIAALWIRLAQLRADALDDIDGARRALDRALELVPNHPTALSVHTRLADTDTDPRAYAEARLREADALRDIDDQIAALLDAGRTLRERCGDSDAARAAFERVLALRPAHPEATWELAGLIEESGDPDAAAELLERQLDQEALAPADRARILTQLAALARRAGVPAAAERRLEEALRAVPGHVPAILARADLLAESEQHEQLVAFLQEARAHVDRDAGDARAEIDRRLAAAYEALGRDDDAYHTLLEADRRHRGNLLVKLALGENRYRARRWREAALHLGALADHPDADKHAAEVAEGLYHAALAEIRALRPNKAEPLYRRAIELKPNYAPALHALAELAMERGDMHEAADLLTRQATATEDPAERVRLFEALGDLALMALHDEQRARVCYEAAVQAASPLGSEHIALLEKLLERQDLAGDHAGAARTAELMASFAADPAARAARLVAAAQNYLAAGDEDHAVAAAERAVDADPYDLTGATIASELMMKREAYDRAAEVLSRALSAAAPADDVTAARAADLWRRLADARRSRGDLKGAVTAYERAVDVAPESDAALRARRELLDLWDDDDERRDRCLAFAREIARVDQRPADILALARMLCRATSAGPVHVDGSRTALELAAALGESLGPDDVAFLAKYPERVLDVDEAYRGALDDSDRAQLIADPRDEPLASVLQVLWEAAPLLWSEPADALERMGIPEAERVGARSDLVAAVMYPHIARALGAPRTVLYTAQTGADITVACVAPPIVALGRRLQVTTGGERGDDAPGDLELRFLLGRAAEFARPERAIAVGLPRDQFASLVASLRRAFGPGPSRDDIAAGQREQDATLRKTLPVKVRTRLEEILASADPRDLDPDRYVAACHRAADRAGLLVCGDIATAIRVAGGPDRARHIIDVALRDAYLDARARLGVATDG